MLLTNAVKTLLKMLIKKYARKNVNLPLPDGLQSC